MFNLLIINFTNLRKTIGMNKINKLSNNSNKDKLKSNNLKFLSIKKVSIEKNNNDKNKKNQLINI